MAGMANTKRMADEVVDGAESGTQLHVLAQGGRYADVWKERTGAAGWRLTGATT